MLRMVLAAVAILASAAAGTPPKAPVAADPNVELEFHSLMPLGFEALQLMPARSPVVLLATAEASAWDGWRRIAGPAEHGIVTREGAPVAHFPAALDFRVTATARGLRPDVVDAPWPTAWRAQPNEFLRSLRFRLLVHHNLEVTAFEPVAVKNIGVPEDVPYDERIYRVSFALPEVAITDRLVLETSTTEGARVCKFHLELL